MPTRFSQCQNTVIVSVVKANVGATVALCTDLFEDVVKQLDGRCGSCQLQPLTSWMLVPSTAEEQRAARETNKQSETVVRNLCYKQQTVRKLQEQHEARGKTVGETRF